MQTNFTSEQLADPGIAEANSIIRNCVHCGFCNATCPTYVLLGDELDSPRGRITLIKDMLENQSLPSQEITLHIDRCLSCLACVTTCPSGVNYMHLVDQARAYIERAGERPWSERLVRWFIAVILPYPGRLRMAIITSWLVKPMAWALPMQLRAMIKLAPKALPSPSSQDAPQIFRSVGARRMRVALLTGCAQQVLDQGINASTIRLLTRHGVEVIVAKNTGCCGALTHHMGMTDRSYSLASANIRAWAHEIDASGIDAIVINASGCGTTVKDYGYIFRNDPILADDAARVSDITKDVSEVLSKLGLENEGVPKALRIAYQSPCSLEHGQGLASIPQELLRSAGFEVLEPAESHLCCGSAGTYNILQPDIANKLRDRKTDNLERIEPDIIASGNIGCMTQLRKATTIPIVHTVEILDWATGGPKPTLIPDQPKR